MTAAGENGLLPQGGSNVIGSQIGELPAMEPISFDLEADHDMQ